MVGGHEGRVAPVRAMAWVALGLVGVTWVLIMFGASVRANGAGLACPDWPLCFGEVIPPIDFGVAYEFGHRVLAGLVSVAFAGLFFWILRHRRALPPRAVWLGGSALVVLAVQIVLGGLTVLELLAQWTVTSHLIAGNLFCVVLFIIALTLRESAAPVTRSPVTMAQRLGVGLFAVLLPIQFALGGLVSSNNAGLVCPSWPSCAGAAWFPTFEGLVGLHLMHRVVAYSLLAAALLPVLATGGRGRVGRASVLLLLLVVVQVALGIANVMMQLPVEVTVLHTGGAAAMVLLTTWLNYEAVVAPRPGRVKAPVLSTAEMA